MAGRVGLSEFNKKDRSLRIQQFFSSMLVGGSGDPSKSKPKSLTRRASEAARLFCCAQCQRLCAASERCWHLCPEAVAGGESNQWMPMALFFGFPKLVPSSGFFRGLGVQGFRGLGVSYPPARCAVSHPFVG